MPPRWGGPPWIAGQPAPGAGLSLFFPGRTLVFEEIKLPEDAALIVGAEDRAVPVLPEDEGADWTPARRALSERRRRATAATASHARRVRRADAAVESFDPREVYERDGWACGLCGKPVDPAVRYPDPMCPSLDHIIPLVAGGDHSRANTQLAHWYCNVRKGASVT